MVDTYTFVDNIIKAKTTKQGYSFQEIDKTNFLIETNSEIYYLTLNKNVNQKKIIEKCKIMTKDYCKLIIPFIFVLLNDSDYLLKNLKTGKMIINFF
jgi:hypothetical protein